MVHLAVLLVSLSPAIWAAKQNHNSLPLLTINQDSELLFIVLLSKLVNSEELGHDGRESGWGFHKASLTNKCVDAA